MQDLDELQSEKLAIVGGGDHENHEIHLNIEEEKRERGKRREKKKELETENRIEVDEEGIEIVSRTNSQTKTRTRTRTQNRESGEILINWHLMTPAELVKAVECHEMSGYIDFDDPRRSRGLSEMDSVLRLERNGKNVLTGSKESSALQQYLAKFLDPLMVVLIVAGILSFIIWALDTSVAVNLYLALALVIIVVVSASLAYIQEGRSRAVMAHFVKLMPRKCRVIRTGREVLIDASDLVVGDLVLLRIGDAVPADIRLVFTTELKIESSALTGESVPVTCETDCEDDSMALFEALNIAWSSTNVMEGEGVGVVFACGNDSRMGRIGKLTNLTENVESTLQKELKRFVYILVAFASAQAILFYCIALGRKKDPVQSLVLCLVVIMVANVPQGLPSTVVSLLTIVGKRLADSNVNVKKLQNVETLGSCTVIASDKTGTITQNKMSVSQVWVDMRSIGAELAKSEMPVSAMTSTMAQLVRMPMHARLRKTSEEGIRWESSPNVLSGLASSKFQDSTLPHTSFGSEAVIKVVRTFANLELVATLCNRAKFEDEKQLTDEEASHLFAMHHSIGAGRNRRYETSNQLLEKLQQDRKRNVLGDASDKALFNFISGRQSIELLRYQYRIIFEIPFSSSKKFSLVIVQPIGTVRRFLLMKGAPEVVLERCQYFQQHGVRYTINEEFLQAFDAACRSFADDGERVLGFAMLELSVDNVTEQSQSSSKSDEKGVSPDNAETDEINANNLPLTGYQFLGMISLVDPPKPKVAGAVEECRNAGIKVIMVTGDHPLTAVAIAGQVGIVKNPTKSALALQLGCREEEIDDKLVKSVVVTGRELNTFTNADWDRVLSKEEIVFARTTPEHKLSIVQHLQAMGHVVAVTGDGVNDAPALKKADIGVAMGINGSDVARSAGDIVLMDDDFSSIVLGIKEGRVLFDNIMKTTAYTLTHLWPEVLPVLLNIAFDVPLAMNSLPVLGIDTGTELAPAIALAYEKAEGDVMHRKPRDVKKDRLASWGLLSYSYAQIGCLEFLIAWVGFVLVFRHHDVPIKDLAWSATKYWNSTADPYVLSNGNVLSRDQQLTILGQAQALYWFLVVSCQMIHVYLVRTRTQSILEHGLFGNMILNYGLLVEVCVCGLILFVPTLSSGVMQFDNNIPTGLWFLFLFGWGVLFLYIEGFKWMKRNNYGGRVFKSLGY